MGAMCIMMYNSPFYCRVKLNVGNGLPLRLNKEPNRGNCKASQYIFSTHLYSQGI